MAPWSEGCSFALQPNNVHWVDVNAVSHCSFVGAAVITLYADLTVARTAAWRPVAGSRTLDETARGMLGGRKCRM